MGLESEEGVGSKAWFVLPFQKETSKSTSSITPPQNPDVRAINVVTSKNNQNRKTRKDVWILVAEDNKINQTIALKNLKRFGFNSVLAENGKEALELLAGERTFDLILMDLSE